MGFTAKTKQKKKKKKAPTNSTMVCSSILRLEAEMFIIINRVKMHRNDTKDDKKDI